MGINEDITVVYLLRHARSSPSPDVPEPEWPLSSEGKVQASALKDQLSVLRIDRVISSPYPRAIDTVRPFCERSGLQIVVEPELRERKLTELYLENWYETLKKAWSDFDFALPNCETGRVCQERMKQCILRFVQSNPGKNGLACSHGNAIGLFLNHLDPSFGFNEWEAIWTPDLFRIVYEKSTPEWDKGFMFEIKS